MEVEMVKVWSVFEAIPYCGPESDPFLFDNEPEAYHHYNAMANELSEEDSEYFAFVDGPFWVHEEEWNRYQEWGSYPVLHTSDKEEEE
jgi:hypothetical protein